jgi:DNA-binding SARP family transcriptional activator/exonuclease VII small subunit
MARSLGPHHDASTTLSDIPSILFFLEKGLDYIKQGYEAEACAVFTLAREQLASNQEQLTSVLDTFIQGYMLYRHAQQELQKASQRFSDAYAEQQARTAVLGSLLPKLVQEIDIHPAHLTYPLPPSAMNRTGDDAPAPSPYVGAQELSTPTTPDSSCLVDDALPALYITSFGRFTVKRLGHCVALCPNRTGQAILRYLLTQPGYRASLDKLIAALLPDHDLDASIHKVRVAVSALRRSLNGNHTSRYGSGYILCKSGIYQLNPAVRIYTDADEFLALYQTGRRAGGNSAVPLYETACHLYTGPFLVEDLYADWSFLRRGQFSHIHLEMCGVLTEHYLSMGRYEVAIEWATRAIQENRCDEKAHRQLIQAYALQGRRSEALLHYQTCVRTLTEELGVPPSLETVNLFKTISSGRKEVL